MTVNQFIKDLQSMKESLRQKEIKIQAPNGLYLTPKIKIKQVKWPTSFADENIEFMVVSMDGI